MALAQRDGCQLEIQLLQQLEHPGVVEYVESFQLPKTNMLCIVMAFCEGGDLTNYIKKQRANKMSEKDLVDYFVQMALALHFMHGKNILHRDLKTQNIFLKNGTPRGWRSSEGESSVIRVVSDRFLKAGRLWHLQGAGQLHGFCPDVHWHALLHVPRTV